MRGDNMAELPDEDRTHCRIRTLVRIAFAGLTSAAMVAALVALTSARAGTQFQIRTLSNRPDMLSGGDALVHVDVPANVSLGNVRVMLNSADVTDSFHADESGHAMTGLVKGLGDGTNVLSVAPAGAAGAARLSLVNHAITGPVFSGPQEQPFICETETFKLSSGGTLGPAVDANCSVATRVDYLYRPTSGGDLEPLPDPNNPPADVATTKTLVGQTIPYIVRIETGTINRAVYRISMLHNPAREPAPDFKTKPAGWNNRLIYTFGGGCSGGWYRQGATTGGVEDDVMLRQGYAVASASLNVFGNNCNDLLAAETMMMVKERFIESYGQPLFTIGWGCSGGAYQVHQIADNYPGLLDGIVAGCSFPDVAFGTIPFITDARLLNHYFSSLAKVPFSDEQKRQVAGFVKLNTMTNTSRQAGRIAPTEFCPAVLPSALRYDAEKNPKGARCDVYDHTVNAYGRDPKTGFARRPLDNVGVQYGLGALNAGAITKEQFLDLNEQIGGYDEDAGFSPARTTADLVATRAAYRTGRLTHGGGGLARTPIIDYRNYTDDLPNGDIHLRYHSFSMRERLIQANGNADNYIMLIEDNRYGFFSTKSPVVQNALSQMDRWLTRLAADTSNAPPAARVRRALPSDVSDACWTRDASPQKIVERQERTTGPCAVLYPPAPAPREVAGASVASNVIKCQLEPIDPAGYKVTFTADEMARLKGIFAGGVCDWSKPGVEQQKLAGTWQKFSVPPKSRATQ